LTVLLFTLAVSTDRSGFAQESPRWSVETPTGPTKALAFDATEATWMSVTVSPDGRSIAFDLLGHIYEMPIEGGTAKRLTDGRAWNLFPRYSPDGRSIAFASDRSGSHNIWILDRQSGALRTFPAAGENLYRPVWSADGRAIYAGTSGDGVTNQLLAFALAGGRQTLVRDVSTQLTLLPSNSIFNGGGVEPGGTGIIFERSNRPLYPFEFNPYVTPIGGARIERYDQATGEITVMVERQGGAFAPALSPDGRQLAYVNRSIDETILVLRDLASRRERVLLRGLDRDRQESFSGYGPYPAMAWHPDGRRLFLGIKGHLTSVDVQTGTPTTISFHAPVERQMSQTIRFKTEEARDHAMTRTHRWGSRTPQGILFEALGDLWLQDAAGARKNLTHSAANETSPVFDPKTGALYYASWTDDSLGAVYRSATPGAPGERLTSVPAQYGGIAVSPDGARLAYVRGAGGLEHGLWLSNETEFDLVVRAANGTERRVTGITGQPLEYANIAGKVPPSVTFAPNGETLYFTEFERDTLVLKRIGVDGAGETVLFRFPNAVAAVPSPDLAWIAFLEYHRSFITPFTYSGQPVSISPFESTGFSARVDPEDGGYLTWSPDGRTLAWTRATGFYEKPVDQILAESRGAPAARAAGSWTGPRVPGSTARRTETAMELTIDTPKGAVALTGVRVVTMNPSRQVLEGATIVVEGGRITAIGKGAPIPAGAKVFDLPGRTVIPGLVDAHAHPHIEHSSLHVIEQQPTYLSGPLAYGVTTVIEVYGNEYRDGWLSDMLRAGKITGPRFFTTGSVIYGARHGSRLRMYRPIETLDDAREQLRWNKDHGAIAVKDYNQDTRKRRHLTITAARELGLNVVSESDADPEMNLTQLMDGVTGIEHSMGLAPFYDDVVRYWGGTAAGMTPTLLVVYNGRFGEGWYHQASKLWEDSKLTHFITPEQLMRVRNPTHLWPEDMYAWKMGAEVKKLYLNGTSIQMGGHGQMFGLDDHWELDLLVRSGFTPAQALEIGTIKGATHHGLDSQIGSLEVGKLADLVVLDANPLDEIGNAQKIRYVMKNGVVFAGADAARVWPDPRPAGKAYFVTRP
jgi:imidazolonepropionase-like amidohydrolase/Tol biopolymer transport system component